MSGQRVSLLDDEDFSRLRLGKEYGSEKADKGTAVPLWDDAVLILLQKRKDKAAKGDSATISEKMEDVIKYLEKNSKYEMKAHSTAPSQYQKANAWLRKNFQEEEYLQSLVDGKNEEERKQMLEEIELRKERFQERRPEGTDLVKTWVCGRGHKNEGSAEQCLVCYNKVNLHSIELATISNLGITDVEEALEFIPTLKEKFPLTSDQEQLQNLLDSLRDFQKDLAD
jgi:hypothetical protein